MLEIANLTAEGPGKRYWDDSLRSGSGIGGRYLFMIDEKADPVTKQSAEQLCASLHDIVELRATRNHGITLVRPDGYIAYEAHNHGAEAIASIRSLLERHAR